MNNELNDFTKSFKNAAYKILNEIPEGLNDFEKARYVYIQLGKYFSYDEEYIISSSDNVKKSIFYKSIDEVSNDKIVCSVLSKIYEYMLNKLGINAKTILVKGKRLGHAYTEVEINNIKYKTDLANDLTDIKIGFKTRYFMETDERNLLYSYYPKDKLKEIDDKIGYTYKRNVY